MSNSGKADTQAQILKRLEKLEGLFSKQTLISHVRICSAMEGLEGGVEAVGAGCLGQGHSYPTRRKDTVPLGPTSQRLVSDAKVLSWENCKTVVKRLSSWKM